MLPEGWDNQQIGQLCDFINGNGFKQSQWSDSGVPIIRIQNLNGSKSFNYYNGEINERWTVNPGDILFAWAGTKGVSFGAKKWKGPKGVLNQHIFKVSPKNGLHHDWLFFALLRVTERVENMAHGFKATLVHVQKSDILDQKIYVPPLSEQRKIAKILQTWDRAIATTEKLIDASKQQKKALMQQLLTGKKRFAGFEGEWEKRALSDVVTITYGKSPKEVVSSDGRYEIIGTGGVIGKTDHTTCSEPAVVIGRKGTIDKPQFVATPFWAIDTTFYCLPISSEISIRWFYHLSTTLKLRRYNEASGVPSLSRDTLYNINIYVPSVEEQEKISSVISASVKRIRVFEEHIAKLRQEKKALMQQLLTGKRRVNVDE